MYSDRLGIVCLRTSGYRLRALWRPNPRPGPQLWAGLKTIGKTISSRATREVSLLRQRCVCAMWRIVCVSSCGIAEMELAADLELELELELWHLASRERQVTLAALAQGTELWLSMIYLRLVVCCFSWLDFVSPLIFFIYFFGYLALHFWHTDTLIWRHVCYLDLWYYLDLKWLNRNTWVGEIAGPNWLNYGLNCSPLNWQLALGSDNRCARTVIDKWHFRAEYRARRVFECEYEYGSEYECEYEYEYDEGAFKNPRPFSSHKHTRTHTLSPRVHSALWLCAYATRRSIGCGVHFYAALCAREVEAGQPDDAAYSQDWFACVSAWVFGSYVQAMLATDVGWHWHSVLRSIMAMDESVCLLPIGCVIVCVAGAEELQHPRLQLQFLLTLALLGLDSTRVLWLVSRFWPCNSSIAGHCSLFSVAFLRFVVRFALLLVN